MGSILLFRNAPTAAEAQSLTSSLSYVAWQMGVAACHCDTIPTAVGRRSNLGGAAHVFALACLRLLILNLHCSGCRRAGSIPQDLPPLSPGICLWHPARGTSRDCCQGPRRAQRIAKIEIGGGIEGGFVTPVARATPSAGKVSWLTASPDHKSSIINPKSRSAPC